MWSVRSTTTTTTTTAAVATAPVPIVLSANTKASAASTRTVTARRGGGGLQQQHCFGSSTAAAAALLLLLVVVSDSAVLPSVLLPPQLLLVSAASAAAAFTPPTTHHVVVGSSSSRSHSSRRSLLAAQRQRGGFGISKSSRSSSSRCIRPFSLLPSSTSTTTALSATPNGSGDDDVGNDDGSTLLQQQPLLTSSSLSSPLNEELDRILLQTAPIAATTTTTNDSTKRTSNLRQAVTFLEKHGSEIKLSKSNWDGIFAAIEEATAAAEENTGITAVNPDGGGALAPMFPLAGAGTARQDMTDLYAQLQALGELRLYGAVTSQLPPAAGGTDVSPRLLQDITGLPIQALTPAPTNSLLLAGAAAAVFEGLAAAATGVDLNALVLTTLLLVTADRLFLNGAVLESFFKVFSPGLQEKILRHEAGHLTAAYLLGCPVEGIVLSAWGALQDKRFGSRQVSAGMSFFDPILSQQINGSNGNNNSKGAVTRSSIDRYSIIVMAGIAAEAEHYGQADGGASDELALVAFLSRLGGNRNGAWNSSDQIRNQARWGALQAVLLLRQYRPAYEAAVDALERGGRLGDCIYAMEKAAREHNLPSLAERKPLGYIVKQQSDGVAIWTTEDPLLGQAPNKDELLSSPIGAAAAATPPATKPVLNKDEARQTLQDYRIEVEQKLKDVEEKLKDLK